MINKEDLWGIRLATGETVTTYIRNNNKDLEKDYLEILSLKVNHIYGDTVAHRLATYKKDWHPQDKDILKISNHAGTTVEDLLNSREE